MHDLLKKSLLLLMLLACVALLSINASAQTQPQSVSAQQPSISGLDDKARGIALYQQGDAKDAVKALREAVKQHQDDADAWYYLGLALSLELNLKDARQAFEKAVMVRPDFALARAAYAYALMLEDRWPEAEVEAERTLRISFGDERAA